ncbi:exocyst complex subunit 7 [Tieghemostelium lacteum]|uniref:Exocyst subunit Exo70 family protein n=1 Tax=Tieghemostelium lacteum TaxID=361077 RepID=A0A151ZIK8_TIELA|nr:exocyst complex subunit 7 [Tieghemostelium lacteum]|eukprot:KYQ93684.1 exocyst complex subunit 7 [Tieghemostelium lacteum]
MSAPRLSARASVLDSKKGSSSSSSSGLKTSSSISPPLKSSLGLTKEPTLKTSSGLSSTPPSLSTISNIGSGLKSSSSISPPPTIITTSTSPPSPQLTSNRFTKQSSIGNLNSLTTTSSPTPNRNSIMIMKTPQLSRVQGSGHQRTGSRSGSGGGHSRWGSNIPSYQDYVDEELFYSTPNEEDDEEFEQIRNLLNSEYSVTSVQQIGRLQNEGTVVMSWKGKGKDNVVDEQFQQDKKDLSFIKDTLNKTDSMSKQMIYILDSFNSGLSNLEKDVAPINASMKEWSTIYNNINATMETIKSILEKFDITKLETKIREGAKGDYESYMFALEQVGKSIDYLQENTGYKSADRTLAALKDLKQHGIGELENNFKSLLVKISNIIDPTTIPKLPSSGKRYLAIIPPSSVEEISKSIELFSKLNYHGFLKEYKDKRSKFILNSLRKMAPEKFLKQISETKNLAYVKGSHPLISYTFETLRLYQIESDLAKELFGDQYHVILEEVIDHGHELLLETTEPITKFKKSPGDKIFSIFPLLDLFDNFTKLLPDFINSISVRDGKHINELKIIISNLEATCTSLLDFSLESESKYQNAENTTVDEVTSNTLNYFKRLIEYKNSVEFLLSSINNNNYISTNNNNTNNNNNNTTTTNTSNKNRSESLSVSTNNQKLYNLQNVKTFNDLFEKTLKNLQKYLQARYDTDYAKSSNPIRGTLFLVNNYRYILTSLSASGNLIDPTTPIYHEFEVMMDNEVKKFIAFWQALIDPLKSSSGLDSKTIQKRFTTFTKSFSDLAKLKFEVPDKELQQKLKSDVKSIVSRTYERFKESNKLQSESSDDINRKIDRIFDTQ